MIRHNLFYKLLALVVALSLWFYVNSERNPQSRKVLRVPVRTANLAKGYVAEMKTSEVGITIEGPKAIVDDIRKEDVEAWVDLSGARTGARLAAKTLGVRTRISGLSEDDSNALDVTSIPRVVKVSVEALSGKRLPIEVKYVSAPPLGCSYSNPVITPASVNVSGRDTEVSRVKRAVLTLHLEDPKGFVDSRFEVTPVDSSGRIVGGVKLDPCRARLRLEVVEVPATKTVVVSPTITGVPKFPARVIRIGVTPSQVSLAGKPAALVEVSTIATDEVSVEGVDSTFSRDVAIRAPAGVEIVGRSKVRVTVQIGD